MHINTDLSVTGFEAWETDAVFEISVEAPDIDPVDKVSELPDPEALAFTQPGDLWRLGDHFILCGNARSTQDLEKLVSNTRIALVLADPPYNVPVVGHVTSNTAHTEFHEASGETTSEEFEDFLATNLGHAAAQLKKGGLLYAFIDWSHLDEMSAAMRGIGLIQKQLCIWVKENS